METSIHERIAEARHALTRAGIAPADAALDAEVLARHVLGWDRATLLARARETLPPGFEERFTAALDRRAAREPVALIVGRREFWGLEFEVTPDVLIPRPETEAIVEEALSEAGVSGPFERIIDVGTGSGCLAIALAREFPNARVVATDVSLAALSVAARNAARHRVAGRVLFVRTNFADGLAWTAELIVANPPYVPTPLAHALQPEVLRYEPAGALFSGQDGMSALRAIFADAPRLLAPGGLLVVEFGFGQEDAVRREAEIAQWRVARIRADLQGIPRAALLRR